MENALHHYHSCSVQLLCQIIWKSRKHAKLFYLNFSLIYNTSLNCISSLNCILWLSFTKHHHNYTIFESYWNMIELKYGKTISILFYAFTFYTWSHYTAHILYIAADSKRLIESYLHKGPDRPAPLHNLPYF